MSPAVVIVTMSCNVIWDYYNKCETDVSKAKCLQCSKLLSLGSDKPGKQMVHGLKMHLEKCHKEVFTADNAPHCIRIVVLHVDPLNGKLFWAALLNSVKV